MKSMPVSSMRVGVVVGSSAPTQGGGYTFRESLRTAIKISATRHDFVILDDEQQSLPAQKEPPPIIGRLRRSFGSQSVLGPVVRPLRQLALARMSAKDRIARIARLEQRILESEVDLVWFVTPANEPVSVPYFATVWDLQHRLQPWFPEVSVSGWKWEAREQCYETSLPRASRIITGTEAGKKEIMEFYRVPAENIRVVPLPAPKASQRAREDKLGQTDVRRKYAIGREFVFYPAQYWPHKNHIGALRAIDLLKRTHGLELDVVFVGADKGNREFVAREVDNLGLKSQAHLLDFVPREALEALYKEAVALLFPSYFGPDNLPPLEAFSLGCPVLAARVPGAEEQLSDAALFFDPADPTTITDAIMRLKRDPELRARLVDGGYEVVADRTPEKYLDRVCAIIDEFEPLRRCWGKHYTHT